MCKNSASSIKKVLKLPNTKSELGRLLISQSGATHLSSIYSVIITLLCWGLGSFILLTGLRNELFYLSDMLIAVGALSLLMILLRGIKSIACYERGVVVRQPFKSRTILHSDVAGIEFLTVAEYKSGIYQGTTSHFEIIPCVDNPVKIRIWGSRQDGQRVGSIVQFILSTNPDAKLLKIRGFDELN
jgi:hypothetical protein